MDTSPERLGDLTRRYQDLLATTDAVRWLSLKAHMSGSDETLFDAFAQRYPRSPFVLQHKAAVPPVGLGPGDGAALLPPSVEPIITLIQKQTLPTRLALRKVPFNVPVPVQSALGTYHWTLQGQPKPASRIDWTSVQNPIGKVTGIVPLTRELVKLTPGTEGVMATALTAGAVAFADAQFLDPTVTLDPNGRPASITNGVTPITATGTTLAEQVAELLAALFANRPQTRRAALVAPPGVVAQLPLANGTFSTVQIVASPEAGNQVVALDADAVIYSDDGGTVDTSEEATVLLDDAPSGTTILTSFWQSNYVGFRVERFTWWQTVEPNAVQTLVVA